MVLDCPAFIICIMHVHAGGEVSVEAMKTRDTVTQFLTSKYLNTISW